MDNDLENSENKDDASVDFPRSSINDAKELCDEVPEGPPIEGVFDLLTHWNRINPEHTELQLRDGGRIELAQGEKGLIARLTRTTRAGQVTVEVVDISKFTDTNIAAKRVFNYVLTEAKKIIRDGKPTRKKVVFPLNELIRIGMYKSERTARRGFETGAELLMDLKVGGTIFRGAKQVDTNVDYLFTGYRKSTKQCAMKLNTDASWESIMQYCMILPRYYYKLDDKAGDLFRYIWYRARQEMTLLKQGKPFYISLERVHEKLGLPPINGANTPTRDIKVAIDKALENIEEEHSKVFHSTDLALLLVNKRGGELDDLNIRNYITEGQIQVAIKGGLLKYLKKVSGANKHHKDPPKPTEGEVIDDPSQQPQP